MEGHEPVVLTIKTLDEEVIIINRTILESYYFHVMNSGLSKLKCNSSQVFGAFLSTDVLERRKHDDEELRYFGTGECFVFTVRHVCAH